MSTPADEPFPVAARRALADSQLRRNLAHATRTIRDKRTAAVAELGDWEELREAGRALKDRVLRHLDEHLVALERRVEEAGGVVHWARDAVEANAIVAGLVGDAGAGSVVKAKSLTTEETRLNDALEQRGIEVTETDLAELIIQLGHDAPSHVLVPAIHRNRAEVRELFARHLEEAPADLWTTRASSPRWRVAICAGASSTLASASRAPTSPSRRPARSRSSSRRATVACARRCPSS